jgi:glycine cleavage system regulatory protein
MDTTKIKTTPELQELVASSFTTLRPNKHNKDSYKVELEVEGYLNLLFTVSNLLKVSIMALDSEDLFSAHAPSPQTHIRNMLEIALQLLPLDEAEFLDKIREQFLDKK